MLWVLDLASFTRIFNVYDDDAASLQAAGKQHDSKTVALVIAWRRGGICTLHVLV
ncbi:MAG TPA: hypothetical protein VLA73_03155 [Burkholderiales bacterium]|nr:hypothetical protein [Burkholderiales bacterium]